MKSILDPTFKYIPAANTDIRKTFERVKREQAIIDARPREALPVESSADRVSELRAIKQIGGNHDPR